VGLSWFERKNCKNKNDASSVHFPHFVGIPEFETRPNIKLLAIYPMNIPCFQDFPSIPLWLVKCPLIGCVDPHFWLNHQCLLALVPNKLMPKSWVISSLINEHALDLEVFEGADICVGQNWLLAV
jgi:hypothetical protein